MSIVVDLDGVIFETEKDFRALVEIYDVNTCKTNNIIDNSSLKYQDKYIKNR